jgi:hypothetical protein
VSFYKVRAPNLPRSLPDYSQGQQDQFSNALRLYFNQLDASLAELASPLGAALLNRPCALYYSIIDPSRQESLIPPTAFSLRTFTLKMG